MKYSQEKVDEILKSHGLKSKDKYINRNTKMVCSDGNGYLYYICFGSILVSDCPAKFSPKNPFSILNIEHYFKFNGITAKPLEKEYKGATQKMRWLCSCGNEFITSLSEIERGRYYCDKCSTRKAHKYNIDYTDLISKHCDSNKYTLITKEIVRARDSFDYICNKHKSKGIQRSNYSSMITHNHGCIYCAAESRGKDMRVSEVNFKDNIEKLGLEYVGCKYDDDTENSSVAKILYICPRHRNKGNQITCYETTKNAKVLCKFCLGKDRTREDFQKELDDLGLQLDILNYERYGAPILVRCRNCGYEWSQLGVILRRTCKCPHCTKSAFETKVGNKLDDWGIKYTGQYTYSDCKDILKLPFDYFLNAFNVLIEVDGEGHYKPIRRHPNNEELDLEEFKTIQIHDGIKTKYCNKNHIPLIRIPYWERDNLEYFLWNELFNVGAIKGIAS